MTKKNTSKQNIFDRFGSSAKRNDNKYIQSRFLIVCEGEETEPLYFNSFPKENKGISFIIKCIEGDKKNHPNQIVDRAIELRNKTKQNYDRVWVVFDKDDTIAKDFHAAIDKAEKEKINVAWSNESFEIWYVLHFQDCTTGISRNDYKKLIEKGVNQNNNNNNNKFSYDKSNPNMYELLEKHGDQQAAIKRAKKCNTNFEDKSYANHNPSTRVCYLVEELNGDSKEFNKLLNDKLTKAK